jgi:predicted TIM-barrel fold metal-dependent hydrolase
MTQYHVHSLIFVLFLFPSGLGFAQVEQTQKTTKQWRDECRVIDLHQHTRFTPEHLARGVKINDEVGVGIAVNLSGGLVTRKDGEKSEFERNKDLADSMFPGRFLLYFSLNFDGWDEPDWATKATAQVDEAFRLGAAGFKVTKELGLFYKDKTGQLIKVDDPKLDPVWKRCGELNMPISIHVADPVAFWKPLDATNERWDELRDHPDWWFGDPKKYPSFHDLINALHRVIERHPKTIFVCTHFGCHAEDAEAVAKALDKFPNMMVDIAARVPELGRQDAKKIRNIFTKYADRIMFGTDFYVADRLILGAGGGVSNDEQAVDFFQKHWRWFDTNDRQFEHMTPIQGKWKIDAIGLPPEVQRKILFDNARKMLARSLPTPKIVAQYTKDTLTLDGKLDEPAWKNASVVLVESAIETGAIVPQLSTTVRTLWSDNDLYIAFEAPYTKLTTFEPPLPEGQERYSDHSGLWDRDVVEMFIGSNLNKITQYMEFQVAPTGEKLDLKLDLPDKDFPWSSGFKAAVHVDPVAKKWTTEIRIPLAALAQEKPVHGTRWRINFYRHDIAGKAFLCWNPTLTPSAHTPERFGILEFQKEKK